MKSTSNHLQSVYIFTFYSSIFLEAVKIKIKFLNTRTIIKYLEKKTIDLNSFLNIPNKDDNIQLVAKRFKELG